MALTQISASGQEGVTAPRATYNFFLERSFEPPARRQQVEGWSAGGDKRILGDFMGLYFFGRIRSNRKEGVTRITESKHGRARPRRDATRQDAFRVTRHITVGHTHVTSLDVFPCGTMCPLSQSNISRPRVAPFFPSTFYFRTSQSCLGQNRSLMPCHLMQAHRMGRKPKQRAVGSQDENATVRPLSLHDRAIRCQHSPL